MGERKKNSGEGKISVWWGEELERRGEGVESRKRIEKRNKILELWEARLDEKGKRNEGEGREY